MKVEEDVYVEMDNSWKLKTWQNIDQQNNQFSIVSIEKLVKKLELENVSKWVVEKEPAALEKDEDQKIMSANQIKSINEFNISFYSSCQMECLSNWLVIIYPYITISDLFVCLTTLELTIFQQQACSTKIG